MDVAKQFKRPKPKLDRQNAIKNFDYDASTLSPSSSSLRGRQSLLSDHQTSFRVRGIDGEFDLICRSLGLSGPEDFDIPVAAWKAQRARISSNVTPRSRLHDQNHHPQLLDRANVDVLEKKSEARVMRLDSEIKALSLAEFGGNGRNGGAGGGIKGLRPPPVVLKSFTPREDHIGVNSLNRVGHVSYSDEEELANEANGERESVNEANDECLSSNSSPSNDYNDDQNAVDKVGFVGIVRVNPEPIHSIFSPNGKFRRSLSSSWQKGQLLGSGSYGTVYEGFTERFHSKRLEFFLARSCKVREKDGEGEVGIALNWGYSVQQNQHEVSLLDQGSQGKQSVIQLEQEISLLSQFEHDNIVQYLGTDKDETKLYIFLELVTKGSLANLYQKYLLRDSQVSGFTRQILSGLTYLHDRNVVHRDIKCANILVDASGSVKLADFGLAKATKFNDVKSCKGTAYWMAPEVVNLRSRGYGLAADIWSLGCAVLEMLTRRPPYSHLEGMQALFQIGKGEPPPVPDWLSSDAQDFILKCLQVNPNSRPTAAQLLNHPFVRRPLHTSSVPASPHCNSFRS